MNGFSFIFNLLFLCSLDIIFGFALYLIWRYLDLKYFSTSEIEMLKEQVKFLQEENKKVNGSSSDFWKGTF